MNQKFLEKLAVVEYAIKAPAATKMDLLDKYDKLADMATDKSSISASIVMDNLNCYSVLMNKTLFIAVLTSVGVGGLLNYKHLDNARKACEIMKTRNNIKTGTYALMYNNLTSKLKEELTIEENVEPELIETALTSFGLAEAKESDEGDVDLDGGEVDLFVDFDKDDIKSTDELEIETLEEDEDANEELSIEDLDIEDDSEEKTSDTKPIVEEPVNKDIQKFVEEKYNQYLDKLLQDIRIAYTALFSSGYGVIEPDGLICDGPEGGAFLHFEKGNYKHAVYSSPAYMNDIYSILARALDLKQSNERKITWKQIKEGYNYYPMKLLEFTFGRYTSTDEDIANMVYKKHASSSKWSDYFKDVIEKPTKESCKRIIVDYIQNKVDTGMSISKKEDIIEMSRGVQNELLVKIYKAHVPCLIMSELSDGRMKIRVSDIDRRLSPAIMKDIEEQLLGIVGSKETARIDRANSLQRSDGLIKEFEVVKDAKLCGALPLFAYTALDKLIEQGATPSWDNLVLGRAEDDSIYIANNPKSGNKLNFKSDSVIHISAGSRSGKGVMTLNILGSAIASGIPIFYLDSKPDMASLLKYVSGGKTFAVQGGEYAAGADMGGVFNGDAEARLTLPECVLNSGNAAITSDMNGWSALQYFKALDFCIWLMAKVGKKTIPNITSDDRMIVVADEMWRFQGSFMPFIDRFKELIPTQSQKTKGTANELALYADKLTAWQIGNVNSWKGAKNATLKGTAPVLITIYQELEKSTSKSVYNQDTREGTLLGNGSVYRGLMDVGKAGLVGYSGTRPHALTSEPKGRKFLTYANRYFAYVPDIENQSESTAEFFKPFLILNDTENENDSQSYVGQLKGQLSDNGLDPEEVLLKHRDENGILNPAIGFKGYIEKMGGDAIATLQKSYDLANKVLKQMGYFEASGKSDVLDYLYDFRPEFLLSWAEMDKALASGSMTSASSDKAADSIDNINLQGNLEEPDDDDEALDFGGPEEASEQNDTQGNILNQGSGNVAESAFERESNQMLDDVEQHAVDKSVKLMSTAVLNSRVSSGKINTETVDYYVTKHLEPVIIGRVDIDMSDRDMRNPKSLYHQFLVYSNIHLLSYRLNVIDNYNQYISELINSKERTPEMFKIAAYLYAMQAYTEGTLEYDKLPSKEMLASWMQDFVNPIADIPDDNVEFDSFMTDTPFSADFGSPSEIEVSNTGRIPMHKQNKDGLNAMEKGQFINMVQLPMDSKLLKPLGFLERRRKSLYESETGTSYMMDKYWTYVLNHIKREFKGDTLRVTKVVIRKPYTIMVNKTYIGLDGLLRNPEDYVELEDIVNIHKLFKTFPAIQELILDADITAVLLDEYGSKATDIWKLFLENKKLKYISIKDFDGKTYRHNRESFASTARQLDESLREQEAHKILDVQLQSKNPRLGEEPGIMYRVHKTMMGHSSDYFKKGHEIMVGDGEKSFRKWTKFTLLGLGGVVIGSIAGIPQMLKRNK